MIRTLAYSQQSHWDFEIGVLGMGHQDLEDLHLVS